MHVVITGANRGIGRALARDYEGRGARVTATSRSGETGVALDVTDLAQHRQLAESLDGQRVDLLVCNAGVYLEKEDDIETGYPPEMWAEAFATNVTGVFLTIQALLPNLQAAQAPKVAIISSMMASQTRAPGGSYIYRASKAAALNLGRNLAQDFTSRGIAVGIYHPGWVRTQMGGDEADISEGEASTGLIARFDALSMATTGCFETWDGRAHPF